MPQPELAPKPFFSGAKQPARNSPQKRNWENADVPIDLGTVFEGVNVRGVYGEDSFKFTYSDAIAHY